MMMVPCHPDKSALHGLGLFASAPIKKGTVVWQMDRRIDIYYPAHTFETLPEGLQQFLLVYAYKIEEDGEHWYVLNGDHARHMNHSSEPNVVTDPDNHYVNIAARDIAEGEELLCNYHEFNLEERSMAFLK